MKKAILTSYAAQLYTAVIGIVMMPIYLRYLGAEAFGLVGFFSMMQAWLALLDLGLTPTLSRQMACYKAGSLTSQELTRLLRTLEGFFGFLALATVLSGALASPLIASRWLNLVQLQPSVVSSCISMMALMAGLRWLGGLYRSGLIGLECQILTNGIASGMATLKFVGVLPLLMFVSTEPTVFFGYQVLLSIVEVALTWYALRRQLGSVTFESWPSFKTLKSILPFASSIAFTGAIWVLVMNLDKLLLSHFLPLPEYGYFSLAAVVAGGIILLISPVSQIIQPRLTILISQGKEAEAKKLFVEVSQFLSGLMGAVSLTIAVFSDQLLLAWTGNPEASRQAAPILAWYALGNGVVGLLTLPYMVQFSLGRMRLHVIGNVLFAMAILPCISYAAWSYGAKGTGVVWLAGNFIFLIAWIPLVFKAYLPRMYISWITKDILLPLVGSSIPVALASGLFDSSESRIFVLLTLAAIGLLALLTGWLAGDRSRKRIADLLGRFFS